MDLDQEINCGDLVRILGSKVQGFVVAFTCSLRSEDRYLVEYVDANGNPQEREWSESQLCLVERAKPEAEDWGGSNDNVVPLRRAS